MQVALASAMRLVLAIAVFKKCPHLLKRKKGDVLLNI
jgi:hypothetical protein